MTGSSILEREFSGARVVVTGASGFIGLNLVRKLAGLGADILVIDRSWPSDRMPQVEFDWVDLRHLDKVYEGDYLIHLAAITNAGYAERHPLDTYEVNVLGTVNLLNHVNVAKRIIFPSTALVYKASETPINEDAEMDLSATYALSKMIGEQVIRSICGRMGTEYTIVRFFNIFGPGQMPMYIMPQVLRQIAEEGRVSLRNGSVLRDLIYVDDCIDAVLKLAVTPSAAQSVFNIGSGQTVSIADVAKMAVTVSGRQDVVVTDAQEEIAFSPTSIMADISKLQGTIDWKPTTNLKEGLKRMWDSIVEAE